MHVFSCTRGSYYVNSQQKHFSAFQSLLGDVLKSNRSERIGKRFFAYLSKQFWCVAQNRQPLQDKIVLHNPMQQADDWQSEFSHLTIITANKPFLVDSITLELNKQGYTIHAVYHPIIFVERANDMLISCAAEQNKACATDESLMHFVIDKTLDNTQIERLKTQLYSVLADIAHSVSDWPNNKAALKQEIRYVSETDLPIATKEKQKIISYLEWLLDNNFIILGSAQYKAIYKNKNRLYAINNKTRLGLLKSQWVKQVDLGFSETGNINFKTASDVLTLSKSTLRSTIHRNAYCDTVSIKHVNAAGKVIAEMQFWGLYTSAAYRKNPLDIPVVRDKLDYVFKRSGLNAANHAGKALMHTLLTYPRDELLTIEKQDLAKFALDIANLPFKQEIRAYIRTDKYQRYITSMIYLPRDTYSQTVRESIADTLMRYCGVNDYDYLIKITEQAFVRLEILLMVSPKLSSNIDLDELNSEVIAAAKTWNDHFYKALTKHYGVTQGQQFFSRYKQALPLHYKQDTSADVAVEDIAYLETLSIENSKAIRVLQRSPNQTFNIRLFDRESYVAPSDILPLFNNLGLRVLFEKPYEVVWQNAASEAISVYVHDYTVEAAKGIHFEVLNEDFAHSFKDIWLAHVENDGLNKLILAAGLSSHEVVVFRAITKYLLQARLPFSQQYIEDTCIRHHGITKKLLDYFDIRFNPALHKKNIAIKTQQRSKRLEKAILAALETVASLDDDRILRNIFAVMQAILRTNFYQTDTAGQTRAYVAFKLDTEKVLELPAPRPMFEIFVYSPETEGVHMRGGKVARGGLRWSDRREDFRTEVLGLVKAQMVKNSVIVPVGAKGGFVMKQPPQNADRETVMNAVVACYKTFINALLDVTDNIIKGNIVPPQDVVRYDDDDSYLVVAADKGTATFSDIANQIAIERQFWLGDAFASGGSVGYDHKKMGITARGAWESVKLNFRDRGINIQKQDFTVVGIGDMGGDVFGNGMLLSKHICLLAAFNHLHIFIDPNPDAAASFKERQRLFKNPRLTWDDYNKTLISKGGGVFSRHDKVIKLSAAARNALAIEDSQLTPNQLIHQLLKAPVDLLWNGGIGTYIKSQHETHEAVGDKVNDGLRVNGNELRCLCVGEGGNLGATQRGRIEYALQGGCIDTDFIHNAGGVDCSDHEVNIKILLNALLDSQQLSETQRVQLLENMTAAVAKDVLLSNYWQGQAITLVEQQAVDKLDEHGLFIQHLEKRGRLDRAIEYLPDDETLHDRKINGKALVRPEIAVLLSYAKLVGYDALLNADLWKDDYFAGELNRYFPKQLSVKYHDTIHQHPLKQEILSTFIINRMVNRMGPTFAFKIEEELGVRFSEVVRAYTIAWESFNLRHLWQAIADLDHVIDSHVQNNMMIIACKLIERSSRWLVKHRRKRLGIRETIADYQAGADSLRLYLADKFQHDKQSPQHQFMQHLVSQGVAKAIAIDIAAMDDFFCAFDIVELANQLKIKVAKVTAAYFYIYESLQVKQLREMIARSAVENHWQEQNRSALIDEAYAVQRDLVENFFKQTSPTQSKVAMQKAYANWLNEKQDSVSDYQQTITEFQSIEKCDMAMLAVALRLLKRVVSY